MLAKHESALNEKPYAVGNDQIDPNHSYDTHLGIEQNPEDREHRGEQGVPDQPEDDAAPGERPDTPEERNRFQRMARAALPRIADCVGSVDGRHGIAFSQVSARGDAPRGRSGVPTVRRMRGPRKPGCDEPAGGGAETAFAGAGSGAGHAQAPPRTPGA